MGAPATGLVTCALGAAADKRRLASAIRVSSTTWTAEIVVGISDHPANRRRAQEWATMAAKGRDHSTSEHLGRMIAKGEVRPGKDTRFLPRPIKVQPSDKTAADWVAEGRR